MARRLKIRKLGLEQEVLKLRGQGNGYRTIAQELPEKTGKKISHVAVKNFLDSSYSVMWKTIQQRKNYEQEVNRTSTRCGSGAEEDI